MLVFITVSSNFGGWDNVYKILSESNEMAEILDVKDGR